MMLYARDVIKDWVTPISLKGGLITCAEHYHQHPKNGEELKNDI